MSVSDKRPKIQPVTYEIHAKYRRLDGSTFWMVTKDIPANDVRAFRESIEGREDAERYKVVQVRRVVQALWN
jgi:hypothetical protein